MAIATTALIDVVLSLLARLQKAAVTIRAARDAGRDVTEGELNELMSEDDEARRQLRTSVDAARAREATGVPANETQAQRNARLGHTETAAEKSAREAAARAAMPPK